MTSLLMTEAQLARHTVASVVAVAFWASVHWAPGDTLSGELIRDHKVAEGKRRDGVRSVLVNASETFRSFLPQPVWGAPKQCLPSGVVPSETRCPGAATAFLAWPWTVAGRRAPAGWHRCRQGVWAPTLPANSGGFNG